MGRPVESVVDGSVVRAVDVVDQNSVELQEDIENLTRFQDAVEDIDLNGSRTGVSGGAGSVRVMNSDVKADTDKVLDLYRKHFFPGDDYPDEIDLYAEKFGISVAAADFFDEISRPKNINDKDALEKVKYLDGSNAMAPDHIEEFVGLAEYPKALRKSIDEDADVERTSLEHYRREIDSIEQDLLELNREYTLPMGIDSAIDVVDELEELEDRVDGLRERREHELRRRPDILDEYFEKNLEMFYEDEEFDNPVLSDLDSLEGSINEAYDNIVV